MVKARPLLYPGLMFVAFSWAMNTVLVKYALTSIDPLAFTGLRFLAMTPLAFLLARAMHQQVRFKLRDLPMLIACGACGYGLYQYFWIFGLANTSAFASSLLASLSPVLTLAIVSILGYERVYAGRWFGAAVALFGVAVFEGAFAGHLTFRPGDALTFSAAAIFAIFNVLSARLLDRYTPLGLVAVTMTIGTLIILPGALPRMIHKNYAALPAADWWVFAFSVVFPIVLTFPVWSWGISVLGAGRASLFQFTVPVLAGLLSIAILHSRIEVHQIIGTAVCIGGMAISQLLGKFSLTAIWAERTVSLK
jgi:drug/metabolite transporter (DMT)-like permease